MHFLGSHCRRTQFSVWTQPLCLDSNCFHTNCRLIYTAGYLMCQHVCWRNHLFWTKLHNPRQLFHPFSVLLQSLFLVDEMTQKDRSSRTLVVNFWRGCFVWEWLRWWEKESKRCWYWWMKCLLVSQYAALLKRNRYDVYIRSLADEIYTTRLWWHWQWLGNVK